MKIAVFHNLPPGGAKRVLFEQVKALSRNHELHFFKLSSTDESFLDIGPYCKKVFVYQFEIGSNLPLFFARLQRDFQNFLKLRWVHKKIAKEINSGGYDVALIHTDRFIEAPFLLRYLSIPNLYYDQEILAIVYAKEFEFKEKVGFLKTSYELLTRKIRKEIDEKNAQKAFNTMTNSKFMRNHIKKVYEVDSKICYPGVNSGVFKKAGSKKPKVLFIGSKKEVEGYDLVRKAVDVVNRKIKTELEVLGHTKGKMRIMSDQELAKKYSESIITLCANYVEAFGLKVIESMSCETPVIAANEVGYKETIINGKTGFLLKRDAKEFAEKIIYLIKHPEVVERMGKAGRQHVVKNFSWKKHVQILEQELQKLAR
jgi:glycosyltransferase involved in cell wall biosynthesis